jgi:serine/threonine-protein kinase
MAEVHIGHDTRLGRTVAIKILRSDLARDPSFQARFRREAQAAASLNHPAVVAVYDTGEDVTPEPGGGVAHVPFIVMEYVEGHTVRDILRDGAAVPIEEAVEITAGVLSALEYSHRAGIVHRDIKPANVMLTPTGAVKVMDFGIARAMADSAGTMTQTQAVIGTAQYLSPEQARGEAVDSRSDLYSTGCLLFELLTGRPPFVGDSPVSVAYQHAREEPLPPSAYASDVPEALDRITLKALTKDRERRYRTASEFRNDLEAVLRGAPVSAPPLGAIPAPLPPVPASQTTQVMGPPTAVTQAMPPSAAWGPTGAAGGFPPVQRATPRTPEPPADDDPSRRWLVWVLAVVGVLAVAGIIFLLTRGSGTPPPEQVRVPSVTGLAADQAIQKIKAADLIPSSVQRASKDVAKGNAIETDPPEGELVDKGADVTVYISSGADPVKIEDLTSYTKDAAEKSLREQGFTTITFPFENSPDVQEGHVTRTTPGAGETVDPTTTEVVVYISSGQVEIKDYRNGTTTVAAAKAELEALGLQVDVVPMPSDTVKAGNVLDQTPVGLVPQRSKVTLTEATAPEPEKTKVPDGLVGKTCTEALQILGAANLNGTCQLADGTQAAGSWTVTAASPQSGTEVNVGAPVRLTAKEPTPNPTNTPSPSTTP